MAGAIGVTLWRSLGWVCDQWPDGLSGIPEAFFCIEKNMLVEEYENHDHDGRPEQAHKVEGPVERAQSWMRLG